MEKKPSQTTKRVIWSAATQSETPNPQTPKSPQFATDENAPESSGWKALFTFTTRAHTLPLACAIFVSIAAGAAGPALSIFVGKIFNSFADFAGGKITKQEFESQLVKDSLFLAALGLVSFLSSAGSFAAWVIFGEMQARTCRAVLFDGLMERPISWYDTRRSGAKALVARVNTHIRELQLALSQPLCGIFHGVVTTVASLGVAFYYCWSLTLVTLATAPISALILALISSRSQPLWRKQIETMEQASKIAIGALTAIETVKLLNGQQIELRKYVEPLRVAAKYYLSAVKISSLQTGFAIFMTYTVFVPGFWYGNHLVATGKATTGTVVTTFFSALTATQALQGILPQFIYMEKGQASARALKALAGMPLNQHQAVRPDAILGHVEFRHVTFVYPIRPEHEVLRNVSCMFPASKTTFVIGQSGSGKSTLAQLLLKFYDVKEGDILLDGQSLGLLDTNWIRSNITLVEQYSTLFPGTITDNIKLGGRNLNTISLEDVKMAAEFALLQQTFNDLPDGFDTKLTTDNSLSGGQRQRMALARARLRDTPIMFFDESTSALDQTSRSLVMAATRLWRKGKTTIFISHDIAQIEPDDFVYLFENGTVTDYGTRQELESLSTDFAKYLQPNVTSEKPEESLKSNTVVPPSPHGTWDDDLDLDDYVDQPPTRKSTFRFSRLFNMQTPGETYVPYPMRNTLLSPRQFDLSTMLSIMESKYEAMSQLSTKLDGPADFSKRASKRASRRMSTRMGKRMSFSPFELLENVGDLARQLRTPASDGARVRRRLSARPTVATVDAETADQKTKEHEIMSIPTILRTIWPTLTRQQRISLIIAFICSSVHAGATPAFAYIFSKLFATLYAPAHSSHSALVYSLAVLAIGAVDGTACLIQRFLFEHCGQHWVTHYRTAAMQALLAQPRQFHLNPGCSPAELAQALDRYAEEMRNLLGRFAAVAFTACIMITASISWSMVTCWKLTLIGLSLTPVYFVISWAFGAVATRMEARSNDAANTAGAVLSEACTNIRTVRALTLEGHFRRKFIAAAQDVVTIGIRRALSSGFFFGLSSSMEDFVTAVIFYYGGRLIAEGSFTVEQVQMVLSMLLFTMMNIGAMIEQIPQVSSSRDTASRLIHLANLPLETHEDEGNVRVSTVGDVVFRNVSFAYDSRLEQPVLSKVNLTIQAGTVTALVGSSGSGKSTVASLLLRLYPLSSNTEVDTQPSSLGLRPLQLSRTTNLNSTNTGSITISRRPLTSFHTPTLRTLIAVVPQTPTLFPGTLLSNITYGLPITSPLRSSASVHIAASAAGIHTFIASLPSGYDTLVGDGGVTLSGGQTQRVCIARALVRRPKVLVLDEATSALDWESARGIRETLAELVRSEKGLTVLVITHSVEMMRGCQRVVMLEKGRVVEEGGWKELMGSRGTKGRKLRELVRGGIWEAVAE